jgi:hypothetical protein
MWILKRYTCLVLLLLSARIWQTFAFDDILPQASHNSSSSADDIQDVSQREEKNAKGSNTDKETNTSNNNIDDMIDRIVENAFYDESENGFGTSANSTQTLKSKESSEALPTTEDIGLTEESIVESVEQISETTTPPNNMVDEIIDLDELDKESKNTTIIDVSEKSTSKEPPIVVEDYLTTLSDKELEMLCVERGFDVKVPDDTIDDVARHRHYVEAAQRCLRLDDEINAVIAKNPDLAAELEAEVERMRLEKDRLTKEREEMLAEKALLEQQLLNAGIQVTPNGTINISKNNQTAQSVGKMIDETETLSEVLQESFRLLWLRVYQDIQMVQSVASQVLRPLLNSLKLIWKYSQPTVDSIARAVVVKLGQVWNIEQVQNVIQSLSSPTTIVWTNTVLPVLTSITRTAKLCIISVRQNELAEQLVAPLLPFVAPAVDKISELYRNLKQSFDKGKTSVTDWIKDALNDT